MRSENVHIEQIIEDVSNKFVKDHFPNDIEQLQRYLDFRKISTPGDISSGPARDSLDEVGFLQSPVWGVFTGLLSALIYDLCKKYLPGIAKRSYRISRDELKRLATVLKETESELRSSFNKDIDPQVMAWTIAYIQDYLSS